MLIPPPTFTLYAPLDNLGQNVQPDKSSRPTGTGPLGGVKASVRSVLALTEAI